MTYFDAQLQILDLLEHKAIFTAGYKAILHLHSLVEECEITRLLAQVNVKTKEKKKARLMHCPGSRAGSRPVTGLPAQSLTRRGWSAGHCHMCAWHCFLSGWADASEQVAHRVDCTACSGLQCFMQVNLYSC